MSVSIFCCADRYPRTGGKISLGSWFQEVQSMVPWPHSRGPRGGSTFWGACAGAKQLAEWLPGSRNRGERRVRGPFTQPGPTSSTSQQWRHHDKSVHS